jgi:peptide subunit release factor RF-3
MSVSSEQAMLDNFLKRFKSKIKPTTMTELDMYAIQGVPAFTFVRKIDRSILQPKE